MVEEPYRILGEDEPPPFSIEQPRGRSPFFITCDHASRRIPRRLGDLGLPASELERHIAWDIGAAAVARRLAATLDAFLITQNYSRLVVDCNRTPGVPTSMPTVSETTEIPGNRDLGETERAARVREIFDPYHQRIGTELEARKAAARPTVFIAMHSFTPVFKGVARPWHIGVLYNREPTLSQALLDLLRAEGDLCVGDNQPYAIADATDFGIPMHGERRGIAHVEFEVRQDLIAEESGQAAWAARLARLLPAAFARL